MLSAVNDLDCEKLDELLRETDHANLVLSVKNHDNLSEVVEILEPFNEVTEITQGDQYATLGYVVPTVVTLHKFLSAKLKDAKYHTVLVRKLLESLGTRFAGLLELLKLKANTKDITAISKPFGNYVYLMAAALDPSYCYMRQEVDHTGPDKV